MMHVPQGNVNLVDAAVAQKVGKFVLMSSLLTNGAAAGQAWNPVGQAQLALKTSAACEDASMALYQGFELRRVTSF